MADPADSERMAAARARHATALRYAVGALVRPARVRVELHAARGVWQAWAGAPTWDRADVRGEAMTEAGALRRLLNAAKRERAGLVVEARERMR